MVMNLTDFKLAYSPTHKCYAVYTSHLSKCIERGLILDEPRTGLSGRFYININNLYTELPVSEISSVIKTSTKWSTHK